MISYTEHRSRRFGDAPVVDPETKWRIFYRCAGGTIVLLVLGVLASPFLAIFAIVWFAWAICIVIKAVFKEILEDETHLDNMKNNLVKHT